MSIWSITVSYTHLDEYKRQVLNSLGSETHLFVRQHATLRTQDPLIVETLVEVLAQDGIQLHTKALPEEVVKNTDGSLTDVYKRQP